MTKKVLKKVLKKVPGPIGTVARLSDFPRKISNIAKNAKNLKTVPKRKPGQPRMILGKVPKGINMTQKQYDTVLGNALSNAVKKGKAIRTTKETRGKAVATTKNTNSVRYVKNKEKSTPYTPKQAKSAKKSVKGMDARVKKEGLPKGYSLKDLEY